MEGTFKLENRPEEFRVGYISPVEMMAISTQVDFENYSMTKTLMQFCIEHVEVKIGEKWLPVKMKDKEIYKPSDIVKDFVALNEIFVYMMENVIAATFPKSSESKEKTL